MKILAIRGKNLASLAGEFEIDFTIDPLRSAGIYAITGNTGSGKSTLLDAICLALFNDTPRINRAENADIADVKDLTIKQKDSRNILRRGTSDGYAEVDFISLAGDKYRVRWNVRRSRDKADGSLQSFTYRVFNLSSNCELQGSKKELLEKVKDLIGLTFDQFTRAVLLAQGDFATFLKAAPKEKAELLEKLTGTDVYSRISSKIYEKTKQAETDLSHITERIKDIELLPDKQITELSEEKTVLEKELKITDEEVLLLTEKLNWLQTNELLTENITKARNALEKSTDAVKEAKYRFDYVARIESVQQIRDLFKKLENNKEQLSVNEKTFKDLEASNNSNKESLVNAEKELVSHQETLVLFKTKWEQAEPRIKKARELDIQLKEVAKRLTDIKEEVEQTTKQKMSCEETILSHDNRLVSIQKSQAQINQWFESYKDYANVIPRIDFIVSYISDAYSTEEQTRKNLNLLHSTTESLKKEEELLSLQQVEAKRLNDILPAEIALLRERLIDNEPCPVCGSTHHPISGVNVESLEEQTLKEAKALVNREIDRLTESIRNRKEEIIRLQSLITGYKEQHHTTSEKLAKELISVPDWKAKYENETISNELKTIAKEWNKNLDKQTLFSDELSKRHQDKKNTRERLSELTETLKEKQEKQTFISVEVEQLNNKRKEVLGTYNADDIEKQYLKKIKTAEEQVAQATTSQNNLIAESKKIEGNMVQLAESISRLTKSIHDLETAINKWLSDREDCLTVDELSELLSKDNLWLTAERKSLDKLKKSELSAQATLIERQRVSEEHQKAKKKPTDNETVELLNVIINEKTLLLRQKRERLTEINVSFTNHERGIERIKQFEKELAEKGTIAENWRKLNELFGSADGAKFKVLAQGYTLDVLLGYANRHLKSLSQRYLLERVSPDSLSLQVIDLDMLSEVRSVHSLSGGESFLISLSLALGLSSLSSNKMRVESLFIDEGFGSLDAETLRTAMDALERLQTQGRKIGVISHVTEMTERISTQIKVIKSSNGKSHIEIIGR